VSAEVLRRAGALMRERAEAASGQSKVWFDQLDMSEAIENAGLWDTGDDPMADAEHIASWHPAVALAFADLLDAAATSGGSWLTDQLDAAARAYLGADQ
jgi:hypothetical protein